MSDITNDDQTIESSGPSCWSCRESGVRKKKIAPNVVVDVVCHVCKGAKRLPTKKKELKHANETGKLSQRIADYKYPEGWVIRGPEARGGVEPEKGEELCALMGHWRIFQRIGAHRYSTDDVVTAWFATKQWKLGNPDSSEPSTHLDLGCGIGSVLMMVAWKFTSTISRGVEAQEISYNMAKRSIEYNGCSNRVKIVNADIRTNLEQYDIIQEITGTSAEETGKGKFDLITGTPPYFPATFTEENGVHGATTTLGGIPSCDQSAPARYELRGGVEVYVERASKLLKNVNSRFYVCEGLLHLNHSRVLESANRYDLIILKQLNVYGRNDKPALFAVYEMRLKNHAEEKQLDIEIEDMIVRFKGGKRSKEYIQLMHDMGMPVPSS